MPIDARTVTAMCVALSVLLPLQLALGAGEQSETFATKLDEIQRRAVEERDADAPLSGQRRTVVTGDELNLWLATEVEGRLAGLTDPVIALRPRGRVEGRAIVDFDALDQPVSPGGLDPLSLLRGTVPVAVTGVVHAEGGEGRFEFERATVAGFAVPEVLIQQLLNRYFTTADHPGVVRLNELFPLPAGIDQIVVDEGRAVIVQ